MKVLVSPRKERVFELRHRLDAYGTTISQPFLIEVEVGTRSVEGDVNLIKAGVLEVSEKAVCFILATEN